MALQISMGIQFTVAGDGESDCLTLDILNTPVQMGEHPTYCFIPKLPDSILLVRASGPDMSPEDVGFVTCAEIIGQNLCLSFDRPLMQAADDYTIQVIFGYNGVKQEVPEVESSEDAEPVTSTQS